MLVSCQGEPVVAAGQPGERTRQAATSTVVELERSHGQVLFGFVRRLGVRDDAAAEVVQEALLRLFHALLAGDRIRDAKSWTFHVTYRLAMDEHRRSARALRVVPTTLDPDEGPSAEHDRRHVWADVDLLPERQRAVVYLRFRADLPFADIAATLGITASAARSHCTQALGTLRSRLQHVEEER
jgi:RNA polymerase sigma factor (sigma-70 family)